MAGYTDIKLELRFAWWWHLYVAGLLTCVFLFRTTPDMGKVAAVLKRAARFHIVEADR